jgi:hypothetical protein
LARWVVQQEAIKAFLVPLVRKLSASSFAAKFNLCDYRLQQFELNEVVLGYQGPS